MRHSGQARSRTGGPSPFWQHGRSRCHNQRPDHLCPSWSYRRMKQLIYLPPQLSVDGAIHSNPIQQLKLPAVEGEDLEITEYDHGLARTTQITRRDGSRILVAD